MTIATQARPNLVPAILVWHAEQHRVDPGSWFRAEDKEAFASIRRALAALADQPCPDEAVPWGGSGIYRLRLPGIRILYEVDDDAAIVYVINVAVTM